MIDRFKTMFGNPPAPPPAASAPAAEAPSMQDMRFLFSRLSRSQCEDYVRRRTKVMPVDDGTNLCKVLGKYDLYVLADDVGFGQHMANEGYWEYWLTQFMIETIKPGNTVLDIGANHGYYSLLAADLVGPRGEMIAVEANPALCRLMNLSLTANGCAAWSKVLNIALTDAEKPEQRDFFVPAHEPKNGCLLHPHQDKKGLLEHGNISTVEARRLQQDEIKRLDFVKIDVEGAEIEVFRGLAPILFEHKPKIIAEVNFGRGYTFHDLEMLFEGKARFRHLDTDATLKHVDEDMSWTHRINEDWLFYIDWIDGDEAA